MIIQDRKDSIEKIGGGESQKFSIHVSRKAFQILSDLYSDKPLAIVRELGCNALDSHVSAGKDAVPFLVHLPNSLEPHLEIRDFGTGISPENVFKIYSSYFTSTKTDSNDAIGCLGLGSKSPFAYVDNFTITVRYEGCKRLYLAYFDEGGAPTITLASEEQDNEGNGVAIQIPVKKEDCDKFVQAAKTAFKWFAVKPNITGAKIDWKEMERKIVLEGKGWRILASVASADRGSSYNQRQESFAVMGGVNYKIDENKVSEAVRPILSNTIIEFPIGELDFTPSREALSYDDRTVAHLNKRLAIVKSEITDKANKEISTAQYLDDAARIFQNMPDFVRNAMGGKLLWKGQKIEGIKSSHREFTKRSYRKNLHVVRRDYVHTVELSKLKGISFTLDKKNSIWKVKEFLASNSTTISSVLVFDNEDVKTLVDAGVNPACFVDTSTLIYAKSSTTPVQRQIDKEIVGLASSHYQRFDSINLRKAITDGAKYYAIKSENSATIKGKTFDKSTIRNAILGNKDYNIAVFVAPSKEKLALAAGLVHIDTFIDKKLKTLDSQEGQHFLSLRQSVKRISRNSDNTKKYIKIARDGKSGLAKHLIANEELGILEKKFADVCSISNVLGIVPQAATIKLPELSDLEQHLFDEMNSWSGISEKAYAEYETLVSGINYQKNSQIPLTTATK